MGYRQWKKGGKIYGHMCLYVFILHVSILFTIEVRFSEFTYRLDVLNLHL